MKTILLLAIGMGCVAGAVGGLFLRGAPGSAPPARRGVPADGGEVAANGVVEGARPEVALRPEVAGTIAAIPARENQDVPKGDAVVELRNQAQKAQVALARADLAQARAQLERLRNGERAEKRKAAAAVASARRATFLQAKAEYNRSTDLLRSRSISQEQVDAAYYKMMRSEAEWQEAKAEFALTDAAARADDVKAAEAKVAAAEARLELARADLAKTRLAAPFPGRVLQVFAEPGETAGPATAQPVLLLADLSRRRVRAFVEELDVARVLPGQRAVVTADGLPGKEFAGTVALVLSRMGRRAPQSDVPGEYKDVYYREVLIDLDGAAELPTNLRVQVRIRTEPAKPKP
jgi:multidrug resistance efflux pump